MPGKSRREVAAEEASMTTATAKRPQAGAAPRAPRAPPRAEAEDSVVHNRRLARTKSPAPEAADQDKDKERRHREKSATPAARPTSPLTVADLGKVVAKALGEGFSSKDSKARNAADSTVDRSKEPKAVKPKSPANTKDLVKVLGDSFASKDSKARNAADGVVDRSNESKNGKPKSPHGTKDLAKAVAKALGETSARPTSPSAAVGESTPSKAVSKANGRHAASPPSSLASSSASAASTPTRPNSPQDVVGDLARESDAPEASSHGKALERRVAVRMTARPPASTASNGKPGKSEATPGEHPPQSQPPEPGADQAAPLRRPLLRQTRRAASHDVHVGRGVASALRSTLRRMATVVGDEVPAPPAPATLSAPAQAPKGRPP